MATKDRNGLTLRKPGEPLKPPARGRIWFDTQIADEFFNGLPHVEPRHRARWARRNIPRGFKIGRRTAWYEADVMDYIESLSRGRDELEERESA